MTVIGYARVSTFGQDLSSQILALETAHADQIYQEKFTGTTLDRPVFERVLAALQPGDTLMVTKLDRFARNTLEALQVIQGLFAQHVSVHILNMGEIADTPTGRLVFSVFSAFAEFERDMIVTRTQEGKAHARATNPDYREGRPPKYTDAELAHALTLLSGSTYASVAARTGISRSTLQRARRRAIEAQSRS